MIPMVEQAPESYACGPVPRSAGTSQLVGTKVRSSSGTAYWIFNRKIVASHPITGKPVFAPPQSSGPIGDQVPTISKQTGDHPAPIPPVGTVSPQAVKCVAPTNAAPAKQSNWSGVALFAGVIILLWIFAGASLRRYV